jgi:hypothetical protein
MSETTAYDLTSLLKAYLSEQPHRALGGVRALSGFEYQLRSYLADFGQALVEDGALHQGGKLFANALEALSDHTRTDGDLTVCVQVKRTLRADSVADAAAEFAVVDAFLEGRIAADRYAQIRYECVGRSGEAVLDWTQIKDCRPRSDRAILTFSDALRPCAMSAGSSRPGWSRTPGGGCSPPCMPSWIIPWPLPARRWISVSAGI